MSMSGSGPGASPGDLRTLFEAGAVGILSDGQLLERFVARRDDVAFEGLVRRHGPMVMGVCRRVLGEPNDAEDAFQATFIVLARKAATVIPREQLPSWLYGVARRVATRARGVAIRRGARERPVGVLPEVEVLPPSDEADLREVLDQEIGRLPSHYRIPIILCHLEGKGHQAAADQLGWPVGTLSGRLSRGRGMLAKRLSRRGVAPSAGALLASLSSRHEASASVPDALVGGVIRAAGVSAAALTPGSASAPAVSLAEGVLKEMLMTKIRAGSWLLAAAALGVGAAAQVVEARRTTRAAEVGDASQGPPARKDRGARGAGAKSLIQGMDWALTAVDVDRRRVSALTRWTWNSMANDEFAKSSLRTGLHLSIRDLPVAKDAEILIEGKPGTLADLAIDKETYGLQAILWLSEDGTTITKVEAKSQNAYFFLKAVDAARRVVTVGVGASDRLGLRGELRVADDAKISISRGKSRAVEGGIADLKPGMRISFELATEGGPIAIRGIRAEE